MSTTDVTTNIKTLVAASAGLPDTYDDDPTTGYPSLTFTTVSEVIDIGEIAKAFEVVNHQTVDRDYPQKLKDTYDIANIAINLGRVSSDAGQALLESALALKQCYSFKITLASGDIIYFTAQVIKYGVGSIAAGAVETSMMELAVSPESLFTEIV